MPLGASRLNSLSNLVAPVAVTELLNTNLSTAQNSGWTGNDLAYMGNDTSSRPVFCISFIKVTTQYPTLLMFRVNSDLTITKGSEYVLDTTNTAYYVSVNSERDGSGLRTTSGFTEFGYANWARQSSNSQRTVAFSYSLDALTLTLGTAIQWNTSGVENGGAYIGNRRYALVSNGGNNGNFLVQNWVTRTSGATTLTKNSGADNATLGGFGQGGGYNTKGMSTDRWITALRAGNNGHGWHVCPTRTNGSTGMVGVSYTNGLSPLSTYCKIAQLNNSTRFISVCQGSFSGVNSIRAVAGTVTWNTSTTAPTVAVGSDITLETNANSRFAIIEGKADGEAYFIFYDNNDGNKIKYKKLTVSTNTISQSSYTTLSTIGNTDGYNNIDANRLVQVGDDYFMVITARNVSNGNIDVAIVKNPT